MQINIISEDYNCPKVKFVETLLKRGVFQDIDKISSVNITSYYNKLSVMINSKEMFTHRDIMNLNFLYNILIDDKVLTMVDSVYWTVNQPYNDGKTYIAFAFNYDKINMLKQYMSKEFLNDYMDTRELWGV